jgi:Zn-dependent peptidase ImmA (M78 family)
LVLRRGFKAEANRIALRIREQMGLEAIAPIDPLAVCERFEIQVFPLSALEHQYPFLERDTSAFSAVTVPRGIQRAIVHNDTHHPNRQRSNICHELAHCFLGHECTPPLTEKGERARDGGIEEEANFLAGNLLVPNEAAIHIVSKGIEDQAQQIYGVSAQMLNFRIRMSGARTIHQRRQGRRA